MSLIHPLDRLSSTWRLAVLQAITIATSISLCLALAGKILHADLDKSAHGEVLDDIGEHAAVYDDSGVPGIDDVFARGNHGADQAMRIITADGRLLVEHLPQAEAHFAWPDITQFKHLSPVPGRHVVEHPANEPHMLVGRMVLSDGAVLWHARLDIEDAESIADIRHYLWLAGFAAAIIALIPVFWYAAQVRRPVRSMIASAEALATGTGEERLAVSSSVPELQHFAHAFNTVLERNQGLSRELQAANDHLAHELRTPLSRIRGNLETFVSNSPDGAAREAAERGLEEIDRASELVQRILIVRAGDHGALKLHCERTSLRELLTGIIDLYQPSAEDLGLTLRLIAPDDAELELDRQRMVQAIANVLDNALAYTPAGGAVTVLLNVYETAAEIRVQDTGPGLQQEELKLVWQRFVRGTCASAKTPGMGLGLSLVRAIANAHGGNAGGSNLDGGGAEFWIHLPIEA